MGYDHAGGDFAGAKSSVRDRAKTNGSFKSNQILGRISAKRDEIVCKFIFLCR
jgi:hypothetical protein